ncbi:MAG TPA: YdeI/OmpD-associated family protein [Vicinamibacterales bacterium]|nr:YdeI/OmpD-associated family protein [Vicinamibacterales bacterium]
MAKKDPRVDAYIDKAADFAKPILTHLRETVHAACPDVEEEMKWSFPHFTYKGMLCSMAAFKHHAAFMFWKGALVVGDGADDGDARGPYARLTTLSDLPPKKQLTAYIRKAVELNDQDVKVPRAPRGPAKPVRVPADLAAALKKNKTAQATFDTFSPSHRREYVEWIVEAKSDETRARRLKTAIEQMAEGKSQNWKYEKKTGARG